MAEALGLAASVIAVVDVVAKTGSAYVRIQKLWSEVKNVPTLLREKTEDIQIFEEYLANVEDNLAISPLPALASDRILLEKLIDRCRSTLEELRDMVDRIYTRVTRECGLKHRIASAKAALKKEDLEALSLKFDRALRMFAMAQAEEQRRIAIATYKAIVESNENAILNPRNTTIAPMNKAPKQIKRDIQDDEARSRERQIVQDIRSDPTELNIFGKFCLGFEQTGGFHAFFAAPSWLSLSVYSILARKANIGWQISLRTHEIVDTFDDNLCKLISQDDGHGVLKYLQGRGLGLFVRDDTGIGLLDEAVFCQSLNVAKTLIDNGLSIDTGDARSGWRLSQAIARWVPGCESRDAYSILIRMLCENGFDDFLEGDGLVWALEQGIYMAGFYYLLHRRTQGPNMSIEERLRLLRACVHQYHNWWTLDELSVLVPKAALREEPWFVHSRSPGNYSLLHSMAVGAVNSLVMDACATEQNAWAQALTECVKLDPLGVQHADLGEPYLLPHEENYRCFYTPLLAMIFQTCWKQRTTSIFSREDFGLVLGRVLRFWVNVLASAGIDLLEYGRLERKFHETEKAGKFHGFLSTALTPKRHHDHNTNVTSTGARRYFIAGFTYGRLPEHWKMWITCENYEYAGDFWNMIDEQATSMPGGWVSDPVDRVNENWRWMNMESPPPIWSEYRKIKPPV